MQISRYFASLGFEVDRKSLGEVDKTLNALEAKLRKFGGFGKFSLGLSNFSVDQKRLNKSLGDSLDIASRTVKFEVSRFVVNDRNLQAALLRAGRRVAGVTVNTPTTKSTNPVLEAAEWDRRRAVTSQEADIRHQRALELAKMRDGVRSSRANVGLGGNLGFSNFYGPALALGAGGYGLSALNQRNQQVVSAQLQSQAVVQQAGGTAAQGSDSFQYLRKEGQRIGFNYLDASGDYNKLISGLTGSGIGVEQSQKVFSGFAELARVNKLDKTTQNRLFRALSQVAGKGKLMSEELNIRLAT
jgi:hypothetical protein